MVCFADYEIESLFVWIKAGNVPWSLHINPELREDFLRFATGFADLLADVTYLFFLILFIKDF